jgi:hypothetical protein
VITDPPQPDSMARVRWTRWLRALFVVPVLVFVLSASSHLEIRCALTGLVIPACCPEGAPTLAQRPQHASIGERDCCDRTVVATDKLPATGPASALEKAPLPLGRIVPSLVGEANPAFAAREGRPDVGPARSSPPPYLLTHAFLI